MATFLLLLLACFGNPAPDPRVAELEGALKQMRADMDDLEAAYVDQRGQLAEVDRDLNSVNSDGLRKDAVDEVNKTEHGALTAELDALKKSIEDVKPSLEETVELVDMIDEDLETIEDDLDADDDGVADIEERIDALNQRLTELEAAFDEADTALAEHINATRGVELLLSKLVVTESGDVVVTGANLIMDPAGRPADGTQNTKGNFFMIPQR